MIEPRMRYEKKFAQVLGRNMAYVESGEGDPIVFFHGNITSSYMWRNVIPHVEGLGRCIAIDNIGQGDSEKLPGVPCTVLVDHQPFTNALMDALESHGERHHRDARTGARNWASHGRRSDWTDSRAS